MTRVKRGVIAHKRREKILKYAKGFKWGRKSKERAAREALLHAWSHAYVGRKHKKQDFRALWQTRINAAARIHGLSYSRLIAGLKKRGVDLDRKILSEVAQNHPLVFQKIAEMAK
ncbi:MAG: large subunit ribosomal protein L20 [Parcubacteria group bacterium Greene0714_36]|nr:MAG: large subunit ribosomal protein L20 [Parcubacteria group bacterium Greene0714_36]